MKKKYNALPLYLDTINTTRRFLDEKSQLYKFSPDITFLIIDSRNTLGEFFLNPYSISAQERKRFVEDKSNEIINLAKTVSKEIKI